MTGPIREFALGTAAPKARLARRNSTKTLTVNASLRGHGYLTLAWKNARKSFAAPETTGNQTGN